MIIDKILGFIGGNKYMKVYTIYYTNEFDSLKSIDIRAINEEKAKLYFRAIFKKSDVNLIKVGQLGESIMEDKI